MLEQYAPGGRKNRAPLTWRFAFSSPAHVVATFFGSGVLRPASGTWGTLAGALVFALANPWMAPSAWAAAIAAAFFLGVWACGRTGKDIGCHDHSSIVIDEVFAIWLVLATVPATPLWMAAAFAAFRLFDIVKLPPATFFDERVRNGWGVMLDDAVAALYAIALLQAAGWIAARFA